jgi:intraflagellar transport protein 52
LKGTEDDLEYFVREASDILCVTNQLKPENRTPKHMLEFIFKQIVNWKKINPDPPMNLL